MITSIDHIVLTSKDIDKTIFFYCDILGMKLEENIDKDKGKKRIYLKFGNQKINVHSEKKPFIPHANNPVSGALDVCFLSSLPIEDWMKTLQKNEIQVEIGPVQREGATGKLNSIYLRDPDMNLIEISNKI